MIYITAAVISAALLVIGVILLFKDDVAEHIERGKIEPFAPQLSEIENTDTGISPKTKEKLSEQAVKLNQEFDNTTAWIYIPDSEINFPVMYSGDQRDAGPISHIYFYGNRNIMTCEAVKKV